MSFLKQSVKQAVNQFWGDLDPLQQTIPIQMEASLWKHKLTLISLPNLDVSKVYEWLKSEQSVTPKSVKGRSRSIFGCLVAYAGYGYIFIDKNSPATEQRFTIAREVGHFLYDYVTPRNDAISKLGIGISEVLDGKREATEEERVHAILASVKVDMYVDLLLRDDNNQIINSQTDTSEIIADSVALEIIAPHMLVLKHSRIMPFSAKTDIIQKATYKTLCQLFQLPDSIAYIYSLEIARYFSKQESVRNWLKL